MASIFVILLTYSSGRRFVAVLHFTIPAKLLTYYKEVRRRLHVPAVLAPQERKTVIWLLQWREKSLFSAGNRIPVVQPTASHYSDYLFLMGPSDKNSSGGNIHLSKRGAWKQSRTDSVRNNSHVYRKLNTDLAHHPLCRFMLKKTEHLGPPK